MSDEVYALMEQSARFNVKQFALDVCRIRGTASVCVVDVKTRNKQDRERHEHTMRFPFQLRLPDGSRSCFVWMPSAPYGEIMGDPWGPRMVLIEGDSVWVWRIAVKSVYDVLFSEVPTRSCMQPR